MLLQGVQNCTTFSKPWAQLWVFHTRSKLPSSQLLSVNKCLFNKFSSNSGGPGYTRSLPRTQPGLAERSSLLKQPWGGVRASDLWGDSFSHQNLSGQSCWGHLIEEQTKVSVSVQASFSLLVAIYRNSFPWKGLLPRQEQVARSSVVPAGHCGWEPHPTLNLPLVPISLACCKGKCVKVCETLRREGSCKRPDC